VFQSEAEVVGVERDGAADVLDLISHAVKSDDEILRFACM
jgi:hypothetical protein